MNEMIVHTSEDLEVGDIIFLKDKTAYKASKVKEESEAKEE